MPIRSLERLHIASLPGEGPDHCGKVTLATLNIPESCRSGANGVFRRLEEPRYRQALAPRARDAHKGQHGHVVIVGGGPGMSGAARIAGEAALRSGAGLVSIVTHPEHAAGLNEGRPELMVRGVEDAADARALLAKADVVLCEKSYWQTSLWSSMPTGLHFSRRQAQRRPMRF